MPRLAELEAQLTHGAVERRQHPASACGSGLTSRNHVAARAVGRHQSDDVVAVLDGHGTGHPGVQAPPARHFLRDSRGKRLVGRTTHLAQRLADASAW